MQDNHKCKAQGVTLRSFEWNGDWERCREEADKGNFDKALAESVGKQMQTEYRLQLLSDDVKFKLGWSMSTSHTFDKMWTLDKRLKPLSEQEAKILFLASNDVFQKLEFGGRDAAEKRADLRDRISRLCDMSHEMALVTNKHVDYDDEKYKDRWEQVDDMDKACQTLFLETLRIYSQ